MHLVTLMSSRKAHANIEPSMTVVIPQLSLETIFRDYCRGVLHPELSQVGMYDPEVIDDDNFEEVEDLEDISQIVASPVPSPKEINKEPEKLQASIEPEPGLAP